MKTFNVCPQDIRRALDAFEGLYPWRSVGQISGNAFGGITMKADDDTWCFKIETGELYKLCQIPLHWELIWTEENEENKAEAAAERESVGENWW